MKLAMLAPNILVVTSKSFGGSGKHIAVLMEGLREKGIYPALYYYPSEGPQDRELEAAASRVHHMPYRPDLINLLALIRNSAHMLYLIERWGYNIVHTHTSIGGAIGRLSAKLAASKPRVIHTLHAFGAEEFTPQPRKAFYTIVERILDQLTDYYVSPSAYMVTYGEQQRLIRRGRTQVIHNALPLRVARAGPNQRDSIRQSLSIEADSIVVLFCGRLERQKGLDVLLQAIAKADARARLKLVVCGDGELRHELQELSGQLGLADQVTWMGWQTDLDPYYEAADIFVMPSRWESFGLVLIEAMRHRLPIVASRVQAIPEVMSDGGGLLFESENAEQLATHISTLAGNEVIRHRLGVEGSTAVHNKYSFSHFIDRHVQLYEAAAQPMRPPTR